jgi:hypothetical protein
MVNERAALLLLLSPLHAPKVYPAVGVAVSVIVSPATYRPTAQPAEFAGVFVAVPPTAGFNVSVLHAVNEGVTVAAAAGMLKDRGLTELVTAPVHPAKR